MDGWLAGVRRRRGCRGYATTGTCDRGLMTQNSFVQEATGGALSRHPLSRGERSLHHDLAGQGRLTATTLAAPGSGVGRWRAPSSTAKTIADPVDDPLRLVQRCVRIGAMPPTLHSFPSITHSVMNAARIVAIDRNISSAVMAGRICRHSRSSSARPGRPPRSGGPPPVREPGWRRPGTRGLPGRPAWR